MALVASTKASGSPDTVTINVPSNSAGDWILLVVENGGQTITWPSGFTTKGTASTSGTHAHSSGFSYSWKQSKGSEPATYTINIGGANSATLKAVCGTWSGRGATGVAGVNTGSSGGGIASPLSSPLTGYSALASDDACVISFITSNNTGTSWVTTPPAGYTLQQEQQGTASAFFAGSLGLSTLDNLSAGATGTLTFVGTESGAAGDTAGAVISFPALPSTVTVNPTQQTAAVGGTATFGVTATSTFTPLTYQWRRNGTNVVGGSGGTTASYTTPTLASSDNGALYDVVVTDANSNTATSLRVGVYITGLGVTGKGVKFDSAWLYRQRPGSWEAGAGALLRKPTAPGASADFTGATIWRDFAAIDAAPAAINGAASVTQGAQTAAAAGSVAIAGAGAATQGANTILATASDSDQASGVVTQGAQTISAAGTVKVQGDAAITQAPNTVSASGTSAAPVVTAPASSGDGMWTPPPRRRAEPPKPDEKPKPRVVQQTRYARAEITQDEGGSSGSGSVAIAGNADAMGAPDTVEAAGRVSVAGDGDKNAATAEQKSEGAGAVLIKARGAHHQRSQKSMADGQVDWRDVIAEEDQLLTPEMWKSYVQMRLMKDLQ